MANWVVYIPEVHYARYEVEAPTAEEAAMAAESGGTVDPVRDTSLGQTDHLRAIEVYAVDKNGVRSMKATCFPSDL